MYTNSGTMKIYKTRELRGNLSRCLKEALSESIYIERPGNHLILLTRVPDNDVPFIRALLERGKP